MGDRFNDAANLKVIRGTRQQMLDAVKASFGSRSEAGRYAAEQRWKGHVKVETSRSIADRVRSYGGLTVKILSGDEPASGYVVAIRGFNREVADKDFFDAKKGREILLSYLKEHREMLTGDKWLGLWWDKANGEVVLDVVENIQGRDEAIAAGKDRNQQAIWDVENGEEIATGGSGDRAAESDLGKAREGGGGDDGRGVGGVRGSDLDGRDGRVQALKQTAREIAHSEEGDRLYQTGATVNTIILGFGAEGFFTETPIPFGFVEYADGTKARVPMLESVLGAGWWIQTAPLDYTETLLDGVEKATFSSRSEAGRYAAQQRWKGHVKVVEPTAPPLHEQLTPTWDEAEAIRTGRPYAPLLAGNESPEFKAMLAEWTRTADAYDAAHVEVAAALRAAETQYKEKRDAYYKAKDQVQAEFAARGEAPPYEVVDAELQKRGFIYPEPVDSPFMLDVGDPPRYTKYGITKEQYEKSVAAAQRHYEQGQSALKVIKQDTLKMFGMEERFTEGGGSLGVFNLKTGEKLDSWTRDLILSLAQERWQRLSRDLEDERNFRYIDYTISPEDEAAGMRLQQETVKRDDQRIVIFTPASRANSITKDGRFKTTHEHGRSTGFQEEGAKTRKVREALMHGAHPFMDDTKRPVSGVYAVGGVREPYAYDAQQYGRIGFVLKKEAHARATWTSTDSLRVRRASPMVGEQTPQFGKVSDWLRKKLAAGRRESVEYLEAQVHGGVSLADVEYVTAPKGMLSATAAKRLRAAGVKIVEYDSENTNQGKETYGKFGEIPEPQTADGLWGVLPEPSEKNAFDTADRWRIVELLKATFSSRSEAGRYAAQQRWKGHIKEEKKPRGRIEQIRELLDPATINAMLQEAALYDRSQYPKAPHESVEDYMARSGEQAGKAQVKLTSLGRLGTTRDGKPTLVNGGAVLTYQLPNARAFEIEDHTNKIGRLVHEEAMERAAVKIKENEEKLAELKRQQDEANAKLDVTRDDLKARFGLVPYMAHDKNGPRVVYQTTYLPRDERQVSIPVQFEDWSGGTNPRVKAAIDAVYKAQDAARAAEAKVASIEENIQRSTLLSSEDIQRMRRESWMARGEMNAAFEAFNAERVKLGKLYLETTDNSFEKDYIATHSLREEIWRRQGANFYTPEVIGVMKELGVKFFDGDIERLANRPVMSKGTSKKQRDQFLTHLTDMPDALVTAVFGKYKVTYTKATAGGSWAEIDWKTGGSRIRSDGSQSTDLHEFIHAAGDTSKFMSVVQRVFLERRRFGGPQIVDAVDAIPRGLQTEGQVRRPLADAMKSGIEDYYTQTYSFGNKFIRDNLGDAYAGRVYEDDARESMTRGTEYLFGSMFKDGSPKDVDHVATVIGALTVLGLVERSGGVERMA